jgi:hypothetical protein
VDQFETAAEAAEVSNDDASPLEWTVGSWRT